MVEGTGAAKQSRSETDIRFLNKNISFFVSTTPAYGTHLLALFVVVGDCNNTLRKKVRLDCGKRFELCSISEISLRISGLFRSQIARMLPLAVEL